MLFNKEEAGHKSSPWMYNLEIVMLAITILSCIVLVWQIFEPDRSVIILFVGGILLTISLAALISLSMDPDSVRARQSDAMLKLARQTLACMKGGLDAKSAQKICELLMPTTAAIAIAITDKDQILGYAGYDAVNNPSGTPIRTRVTHEVVQEGELRILTSREEIGFPDDSGLINAAIVVPLQAGRNVKGSLKFYYRKAVNISETQKSIAEGFGQLLSTQMAAEELEEQTKLATSMELKALQSQINPHFLYNTLDSIAWMEVFAKTAKAAADLSLPGCRLELDGPAAQLGDRLRCSTAARSRTRPTSSPSAARWSRRRATSRSRSRASAKTACAWRSSPTSKSPTSWCRRSSSSLWSRTPCAMRCPPRASSRLPSTPTCTTTRSSSAWRTTAWA